MGTLGGTSGQDGGAGNGARGADGREAGKHEAGRPPRATTHNGQDLSEVLASIRQLVTAETAARVGQRRAEGAGDAPDTAPGGLEGVLILTPEMRVDAGDGARTGEVLTEGIDAAEMPGHGAPILDEEALRAVVNAIVHEELQGELGDRISRNLRKLVRREIGLVLAEERERESEEA